MAVNTIEECENNVVVLTVVTTDILSEPPSKKSEMSLYSEPNFDNHNQEADKVNNLAPCALDVDIEKGKKETLTYSDDSVAYLKSDDSLARALQREICLQVGGNFIQLLMKYVPELPKVTSRERVYDTPANRSRKYKRSPSFNSRRVLLMFSVLSSLGTIILIYLTLRVRHVSDGSGNV